MVLNTEALFQKERGLLRLYITYTKSIGPQAGIPFVNLASVRCPALTEALEQIAFMQYVQCREVPLHSMNTQSPRDNCQGSSCNALNFISVWHYVVQRKAAIWVRVQGVNLFVFLGAESLVTNLT
jgi:hypothetical protein